MDSNLDFSKLKQNILDVIKEEQIKLGYSRERIRLFYPLLSLNRFLNKNLTQKSMQRALAEFAAKEKETLGDIEISNAGDRFCFSLPPKASQYVHENTPSSGFLYDLIAAIAKPNATLEDVLSQFKKYSACVHIEKAAHGEFDYLVYFKDERPDAYRYCLSVHENHIRYHRFTAADYDDLHFE